MSILIALACLAIILFVTLATWPLVPILVAIVAVGLIAFLVIILLVLPLFSGTAASQFGDPSALSTWLVWIVTAAVFASIPATMIRDKRRDREEVRRSRPEQPPPEA